jgi:hypothetical protein
MGFTSKISAWRRAGAELGEPTLLAKNPPGTASNARIDVVWTSLYGSMDLHRAIGEHCD